MFNSNPAAPPLPLAFPEPTEYIHASGASHPAPPAQDTLPEMAHGLPFSDLQVLAKRHRRAAFPDEPVNILLEQNL